MWEEGGEDVKKSEKGEKKEAGNEIREENRIVIINKKTNISTNTTSIKKIIHV